jgi:hypothetical protein
VLRIKFAVLPVAALAASLLVVAAPPSYAAGESFKVLSVDATGCASGEFDMTVRFAGLDGGDTYTVHTVARTGGLIYMNESAQGLSSTDQTRSWSLFDNFSAGPVPNPGTWPIPEDSQIRIDFTLQRPAGTGLFKWTLVVDGCNTGGILYNGATAKDKDHDFVPIPQDRCPTLKAIGRPNGCPLRERTLSISYEGSRDRFVGFLAANNPKLYRNLKVKVWKVRPGRDHAIGSDITGRSGKYIVKSKSPHGRYYATSRAVLFPTVGQATKETSPKIHVH